MREIFLINKECQIIWVNGTICIKNNNKYISIYRSNLCVRKLAYADGGQSGRFHKINYKYRDVINWFRDYKLEDSMVEFSIFTI